MVLEKLFRKAINDDAVDSILDRLKKKTTPFAAVF